MGRMRRERDEAGRFIKGNAAGLRHGGFSSVSKDMPLAVRRQVGAIREQLARDIGGAEPALTAAQAILIDKTMNLYQVTLCLEAYIRKNGPFRGKKLDPILGQNYIAYVNTIRLNLRELGISTKAGERLLSPLEIAAEIDAEKETAQAGARADDAGNQAKDEEIARPGANGAARGGQGEPE